MCMQRLSVGLCKREKEAGALKIITLYPQNKKVLLSNVSSIRPDLAGEGVKWENIYFTANPND